jgi:uncharacterized Zn ribbon protein
MDARDFYEAKERYRIATKILTDMTWQQMSEQKEEGQIAVDKINQALRHGDKLMQIRELSFMDKPLPVKIGGRR